MQGTKAWSLVRPLVDVLARLGIDRRATYRRLGIAPTIDPEQRVPIDRVFALWADAVRAAGDPGLPIRIGSVVRLDDLHLMGFAILTAPSGHDALDCAIRYAPLVTDSGRWHADTSGDPIVVRWSRDGDRWLGHRIANESGVAQFIGCMRQICGRTFAPSGVRFRHGAPSTITDHRAFFRCPVEFGAADDAFWFERRALDVAPATINTGLAAFVRAQADARLSVRASVIARTRDAIDVAIRSGERPVVDGAARSLGLSGRTLRRHLADHGTSFSALLDDTLRDRARTMVTQSSRSLTDIALALGFSDASAFSHAFRRWHGCSPRALRTSSSVHAPSM